MFQLYKHCNKESYYTLSYGRFLPETPCIIVYIAKFLETYYSTKTEHWTYCGLLLVK